MGVRWNFERAMVMFVKVFSTEPESADARPDTARRTALSQSGTSPETPIRGQQCNLGTSPETAILGQEYS